MKLTNVLASIFLFFMGAVASITIVPAFYDYIGGWAGGDLKTVALIGLAIFVVLIIVITPILATVEDTKQEG